MEKAYIWPFAQTTPLNLSTPNLAQFITLAASTNGQTFIAIVSVGAPPRTRDIYSLLWLFIFFYFFCAFLFFSRNRVPAEPSVAKTCMMAQTTQRDARMCLLGVRILSLNILGVIFPKNPLNFGPLWEIPAKSKSSNNFWTVNDRQKISTDD